LSAWAWAWHGNVRVNPWFFSDARVAAFQVLRIQRHLTPLCSRCNATRESKLVPFSSLLSLNGNFQSTGSSSSSLHASCKKVSTFGEDLCMLLALLIRSGLYYSSAHLFNRAGVARLEYCEGFFREIRDAYRLQRHPLS